MLSRYEKICKYPNVYVGDLYKITSWYLFGFILVYRTYQQVSTREPVLA